MELRVAIGQMDIALGDPETNLRTVQSLAAQAAKRNADLLVLPELWGSGYDLERAPELADELNTGLFSAVASLARHHRLAICGSLLEWDPETERAYNTATLYDADGALRGTYRKIHLIGLMDEDRYLGAGDAAPVLDLPWGQGALAICYDLRFPELFRRYALDGAGLVLLPSEWPVQRIEHWRTLLKARAIENQCFIVACNRIGADRANTFGGRSAAIDPRGSVLVEADDMPGLLFAALNLDLLDEVRSFLPVFRDRRPEVYALDAMPVIRDE
ncbi:MAG TPA: carbon-nitrogen family hydrolase [Herpetosiphonaceae bacterium]